VIRVCLVGCGSIAIAAHGPALKRLQSEGLAELTACCDVSRVRAEEFSERFAFHMAYTDFDAMMETERPDAVFMLLPVRINLQFTLRALERGIPAIMEKPPGADAREARMIETAADEKGIYHAVLFNRRSMPLVTLLQEQLDGERVEAVTLEMCRFARTDADFTTTAIHGIDCLRGLFGDFKTLKMDYQKNSLGATNYYMHGSMGNDVRVDMRFLPCAGSVTERIAVYTAGKQFYLNLPVWSGTTYVPGSDDPGSLTVFHQEEKIFSVDGTQRSGTSEGFVLNGFYDEDKRVLMEISTRKSTSFPASRFLESVELSALLRERKALYEKKESSL